MNLTIEHMEIINRIRRKFGNVSLDLELKVRALRYTDEVSILQDELQYCCTPQDVEELLSWLDGLQAGRLEGFRDAIISLVCHRSDPLAEAFIEKTHRVNDPCTLELMLAQAAVMRSQFSSN